MATKTTDDSLAEIRRHIDELEARADSGAAETRARLQDMFDRLREEEASAWAAVREKAEAVDEKFRQLEIDISIAENRLASQMADDATSFADAAEAELRDWDAAIERLQTRAATKAERSRAGRGRDRRAQAGAEPGSRASDRAARSLGGRVARGEEPRHGSARRPRAESPRGGPESSTEEEDMTTESIPTETFDSKVSNKIDEAASEGERMLARVWKIIAANGVAAILFGFVLALWPDIGLTTIVAVVAVYALVRGVLSGLAAFSAPLPREKDGWHSKRSRERRSASRCSSGTTSPRRRFCTWWRFGRSPSASSCWPRRSSFPERWAATAARAQRAHRRRLRRGDVHRARRGRRCHRRAHRCLHDRHRHHAGRFRARAAQCRR